MSLDNRAINSYVTKNSSANKSIDSPEEIGFRVSSLVYWRWWFPPALLTLILSLVFSDPFAGDWDAVDYTILSIHGEPSSMFLGRMLFMFTNHALWLIAHNLFGLPLDRAYLLFKYSVAAQSPFVIICCWLLARDLTRSLQASTLAAFLITLSPTFILYSGQAMTEISGLLLLAAGLVVHLRGLRTRRMWLILTGAAMLGLDVNIREALGIYGLWLIIAPYFCGWRDWYLSWRGISITATACLIFMICALVPFGLWFALDVDNYRAGWYVWLNSVRMEGGRHPVQLSYLLPLFYYFFIAAPLVLLTFPFAVYKEYRSAKLSLLLAFGLFGFIANIAFFFMYSTAISGRYLLTGLPVMVPLIAGHILRAGTSLTGSINRGFTIAIIPIAIFMALVDRQLYNHAAPVIYSHVHIKDYYAQRLTLLPRNALILAGGQTVSINYYRGLGLGEWNTIGTGGGWPGSGEKMIEIINQALRDGQRVFIDADHRWWATQGWKVEETEAIVDLENHYRFRQTTPSIYEIRPITDTTATDHPNLKTLLEE